jgi:hypothetical protein
MQKMKIQNVKTDASPTLYMLKIVETFFILFKSTKYCACHEKCLRHLPHKMIKNEIQKRRQSHSSSASSLSKQLPVSPNIASAKKNDLWQHLSFQPATAEVL